MDLIKFLKGFVRYIIWSIRVWVILSFGLLIFCGFYSLCGESYYYKSTDEALTSAKLEAWGSKAVSNNHIINYAKIKSDSIDFNCWLVSKDTSIDCPVMYRNGDNMFYRTRNCYGEVSHGGTPFIDPRCPSDFSSKITIIYGELCDGDRLFSDLYNYAYDKNFATAHNIITITGKNSSTDYRLVAAYIDKSGEDLPVDFASASDYSAFLNNAITSMEYELDMDYSINIKENSIILCNCYPSGGKGISYIAIFQPF